MIELTASIMLFVGGFWWGEWYAQRQADKLPKTQDAGTILLTMMAHKLIDKRQWCGPSVEITAEHFFEIGDNKFTLSLCLDADESAEA